MAWMWGGTYLTNVLRDQHDRMRREEAAEAANKRPIIAFLPPRHPFWKMYTPTEMCAALGCDEVRKTSCIPRAEKQ